MTVAALVSGRMMRIHLLAAAAVAVCLCAAQWQWDRAHTARSTDASLGDFQSASPLRQYLPVTSIGKVVSVSGTWEPGARLIVPRASADGPAVLAGDATGSCPWVVDVLRLPDESAIAVVRGCGTAVAAAMGQATVTGTLQPSEDSDVVATVGEAITTKRISEVAAGVVHDGYLVAQTPAEGLTAVTPLLPMPLRVPLHWRNVVYVGNWLIFAAIITYMWRRVIADELRDRSLRGTEETK